MYYLIIDMKGKAIHQYDSFEDYDHALESFVCAPESDVNDLIYIRELNSSKVELIISDFLNGSFKGYKFFASNDLKTDKYNALYTLVGANWNLELIELKENEDIFRIVSKNKMLMIYYQKGEIRVALGENEGTIEIPDIFVTRMWSLDLSSVKDKSLEEVLNLFQSYYDNLEVIS